MKNTLMATHLRLVGMAALWGASWSWGKVVAQSMAPLAAASLRFLLASVALVLWMHRASALRGLKSLSRNQWLGLAAAALTGVFGYSSFFMLSLQLVPAGKAAIVVTLNPGATLLLAAILFREHLNPAILAGMRISAGLSVVGAIVADFFFRRGQVGLGALISNYQSRVQTPQLFAAIGLACLFGVIVFWAFGWLAHRLVGKWSPTQ